MNPEVVQSEFFEKVVQVNRVSKKITGGNKMSLSALVVVGDRKGKVGVGLGKARDFQSAVKKAVAYAKKHLVAVPLKEQRTIPHQLQIKLGAARVLLKPAPAGTGVIAGGAVRVVVEAAGIRDIVSKILGTKNQASNVYATLKALSQLRPVAIKEQQSSKKSQEVTDQSTASSRKTVSKPEKGTKK